MVQGLQTDYELEEVHRSRADELAQVQLVTA